MSHALYQDALKALASSAYGAGTLDLSATRLRLDNPFCGDRIDLAIRCREGRIEALAHETKGCLLCRAAASLLGLRGPGLSLDEAFQWHGMVSRLLTVPGIDVPFAWPELAYFQPVADHPSRHGCVLLPFDAMHQILTKENGTGCEPVPLCW